MFENTKIRAAWWLSHRIDWLYEKVHAYNVKQRGASCEWKDVGSCDCSTELKVIDVCSMCRHYYMIDSGYGKCRALPVFETVAWCRSVCGLFQQKGHGNG